MEFFFGRVKRNSYDTCTKRGKRSKYDKKIYNTFIAHLYKP